MVGLSMVVTCYNLEHYIEESLRSVFAQDYNGPMEVIIIDDASRDNSVQVIESTIEKYGAGWDITFLRNEKNLGVSGATDRGWQQAKYEWIIEIDGDDIQYPDRCTKTARLIEKYPNAGALFLSFSCIDSAGHGNWIRYMIKGGQDSVFCADSPHERADIFMERAEKSVVSKGAYGCSFAINKAVVKLWGPLNSDNIKCFAQDPPWELRAFLSHSIVWSNQLACKYRSHSSNILNYERKCDTIEDFIKNELSMCDYDKKELQALGRMIADVKLALTDNSYSDWNKNDLSSCLKMLKQYELARNVRADWWKCGVIKRIYLLIRNRNNLPLVFKRCLISRLVPLRVFAWLKMRKKKN